MEVPSPHGAGTVAAILVKVGDKVSEGTPDHHHCRPRLRRRSLIRAFCARRQEPDPAKAVHRQTRRDRAPSPAVGRPNPAPGQGQGPAAAPPSVRLRRRARQPQRQAPRARARHRSTSLRLKGTGDKGRITKDDVKASLKRPGQRRTREPQAPASPRFPPSISPSSVRSRPSRSSSYQAAVRPASASLLAQCSACHALGRGRHHGARSISARSSTPKVRTRPRKKAAAIRVTMLAFLMKACDRRASRRIPNSTPRWRRPRKALIYKKYFHIGIAVDTPDGLVVPVVQATSTARASSSCARNWACDLQEGARRQADGRRDLRAARSPSPRLGGIGGTAFHADRQRARGGNPGRRARRDEAGVGPARRFEPKLMLPLCLSYDHRVIDGALAARFSHGTLAGILEDVRRVSPMTWVRSA